MIFTIGHSVHQIERFVELLKRHQIEVVVDVRSIPYSGWQPQFNREALIDSLSEHELAYIFLGYQLGARPDDPNVLKFGSVQYKLLAETDYFQDGIQRVVDESKQKRIALMCAESDPLDCHRTILISRNLVNLGVNINHILYSGELETHTAAMERLLERFNFRVGGDLFQTQDKLEEIAYMEQEKNIAYTQQNVTRR